MKTISNWYEVHADDEVIATFGPISRETSNKAFDYVEDMHMSFHKVMTPFGMMENHSSPKHRDKVIKIVAVWLPEYDMPEPVMTEVIHEEHPTVIEA